MNTSEYNITMADLTQEFDVSSRTIRFYEEKGLIAPLRTKGNQRRYCAEDRFRLKWILRGKRFGYSLNEISEMLELTETTADQADKIKATLAYGDKKLQDINIRIEELKLMKMEISAIRDKLLKKLSECTGKNYDGHL